MQRCLVGQDAGTTEPFYTLWSQFLSLLFFGLLLIPAHRFVQRQKLEAAQLPWRYLGPGQGSKQCQLHGVLLLCVCVCFRANIISKFIKGLQDKRPQDGQM